jgi:hypothetical protein
MGRPGGGVRVGVLVWVVVRRNDVVDVVKKAKCDV